MTFSGVSIRMPRATLRVTSSSDERVLQGRPQRRVHPLDHAWAHPEPAVVHRDRTSRTVSRLEPLRCRSAASRCKRTLFSYPPCVCGRDPMAQRVPATPAGTVRRSAWSSPPPCRRCAASAARRAWPLPPCASGRRRTGGASPRQCARRWPSCGRSRDLPVGQEPDQILDRGHGHAAEQSERARSRARICRAKCTSGTTRCS